MLDAISDLLGQVLEAVFEFIETLGQPGHLLGHLALDVVAHPIGGLTTPFEQGLNGLFGVGSTDFARLDERLHDGFCLLA